MARYIPTVDEIYEGILNDYATLLGVDVSLLGETIRVEAKATAGAIYTLYLMISQTQNNLYPDLSEKEVLIRDGSIELGRTPTPADQGVYSCTITAKGGTVIPESTQFTSNADSSSPGYIYILDVETEVIGDPLLDVTQEITLRALTAGTVSRLVVGDKLTSIQPLLTANDEVVVSEILTQPVAAEDIEDYRNDVLDFKRLTPQGGSPSDYRLWCSEIGEIRRVYPYLGAGAINNVIIYVEATPENSAPSEIEGVPTADTLRKVYYFDGTVETGSVVIDPITNVGRKPLTVANITVQAVIPIPVILNFSGLSDENLATAIESGVSAMLYDVRPFVAGGDVLSNKNDLLTESSLLTAVFDSVKADNGTFSSLNTQIDGNTLVGQYEFKYGYIPYLSKITNNGGTIWE